MKIIDYQIAMEGNVSDLETEVKRLMTEGWQPLGGVSHEPYTKSEWDCGKEVNIDTIESLPTQAMVKYESPAPSKP